MTIPGLSLFYAGLVRRKHMLSVLMQCFMTTCVMSILWTVCGYSLSFSTAGPGTLSSDPSSAAAGGALAAAVWPRALSTNTMFESVAEKVVRISSNAGCSPGR